MELNNVLVFLRHNNERTKELSFTKLLENYKNISVITNSPFYKTFSKMLKIAGHVNYDYFLSIDADVVLLNSGEIEKSISSGVDYMDFMVLDKFRYVVPAGIHLYSKKMISLMFKNFNPNKMSLEDIKRPEGNTVRKCCDKYDIPFLRNKIPIGLHDFMQFRSDVFYKYVYRGWRESRNQTNKWFVQWDKINNDEDYLAAKNGILHSYKINLNSITSGITKNEVMKEFDLLALPEMESKISKDEIAKSEAAYYSLLSKCY